MPVVTLDYGTPDISSRLAIPSTVFAVATPLVVLLRCAYSNAQKDIGADDWSMLVSVAFSEAICILLIIVSNYPLGDSPMELQTRVEEKSLRMLFAVRLLYQATIGITKISVGLFLLKTFGNIRWSRIVSWCLVVSIAVVTAGTIMTTALSCYPVSLAWNGTLHTSQACIDRSDLSIAVTAFDILAWILLIAVGTLVVWKMEIETLNKAVACVIFALGACLCTGSVLRAIAYQPILDTHSVDTTLAENLCMLCEACLAIIFASIPTFYRPLRRVSAAILGDEPEADEMSLGACAGDEESAMPWPTPTPTPLTPPEMCLLRPESAHVNPFLPSNDPEEILRVHGSQRRSLHASLKRFSTDNHARNMTSPLEDPSLLEDVI